MALSQWPSVKKKDWLFILKSNEKMAFNMNSPDYQKSTQNNFEP